MLLSEAFDVAVKIKSSPSQIILLNVGVLLDMK